MNIGRVVPQVNGIAATAMSHHENRLRRDNVIFLITRALRLFFFALEEQSREQARQDLERAEARHQQVFSQTRNSD